MDLLTEEHPIASRELSTIIAGGTHNRYSAVNFGTKNCRMGTSIFGKSLSILIVVILARAVLGLPVGRISHEGRTNKSQLLLWSGKEVKLSCHLSAGDADVTADNLHLFSPNPVINAQLQLNRTVVITNQTSVEGLITKLMRNMSLSNISCNLGNVTLDEITLQVADPPHCKVLNWDRLLCTWEKHKLDEEANWTLVYSRSEGHRWFRCPAVINDNSCLWVSSTNKDSYFVADYLIVLLRNVSGHVQTMTDSLISFSSNSIVEPNAVSGITTDQLKNHSIHIKWKTPSTEPEMIKYRITLDSQWSDVSVHYTINKTELMLSSLTPHTNYTVTIDCIPNDSGIWSEPQTAKFTTNSDVPGALPQLTHGGFRETGFQNDSHQLVEVFFQPVDKRLSHGTTMSYQVKFSPMGTTLTSLELNSTKTSVEDVLRKTLDYEIRVVAHNDVGYNSSLVPVPIFISNGNKRPAFPRHFVVQTDGQSTYYLNWSSVNDSFSYTVYWCNSSAKEFSCEDALQWKTFPPNQTYDKMKLVEMPEKRLRFALSVEKLLPNASGVSVVSSGMRLSNCTYLRNAVPKPPTNFRVNPKNAQEILVATWSQVIDFTSCLKSAYVSQYVIVYCVITNCQDKEKTVVLDSSEKTTEISGVKFGTTYRVKIKSQSSEGNESAFVEVIVTVEATSVSESTTSLLTAVVVTVLCVICVICVMLCICCYRWCMKKYDIQIQTPQKYETKATPSPVENSVYSNLHTSDSDRRPVDLKVMLSGYQNFGYPASPGSNCEKTQLLKQPKLSATSSFLYSETSICNSCSSAESSISCSQSERSDAILVTEVQCKSPDCIPSSSRSNCMTHGENPCWNYDDSVFFNHAAI